MWKFVEKTDYTYVLFESVIKSKDYPETKVYSIRIIDGKSITEVKDISDNYNLVLDLFDMITDGGLCPEHLYDVVEDYLS